MDFDDLDEVAADRIAAGELDDAALAAIGMPEPPDDYKGGILLPLPRSRQFPGLDVLPEKMRATFEDKHRVPRVRLIVFYGAGDSYPFWAQFVVEAADWVDVAVYEWPSHGSRDSEALPSHCDGLVADAMEGLEAVFSQHAKGGSVEGAPFALLGHSIGVLIMLGVARQAKAKFGLEPSAVFAFDRAAPQHRLCSELGLVKLDEDPADFIRIFNPQPWYLYEKVKASENGDKDGKTWRMLQMWMDDIKLQNHTKAVGFHLFKCPMHIFVAMRNWTLDSREMLAKLDPAMKVAAVERSSILNSKEDSHGLWNYSMYEDWRDWSLAGQCYIHNIDADHVAVRRDTKVLDTIWSALAEVRADLN